MPSRSFSASGVFQSTLPARGATSTLNVLLMVVGDFNPRSPHGERQIPTSKPPLTQNFNPRSPHGERR